MKICILGGGTSGWLTALYIQARHPNHEITVVESSRIGIVGAGEGSTGVFADVLSRILGISAEDFLANTGATQKLGIRFHNWQGNGRSYIAPLDNTRTAFDNPALIDTSLIYHCRTQGKDRAHLSTLCGELAERGLSSVVSATGEIVHVHSYHFDGHKVGAYFKQLSLAKGAQFIDSEYRYSTRFENGSIASITLVNDQTITADIFVDATGFARILGQEVGAGWHSYQDTLTCNRAMPFLLPHTDRIDPLTEAYALKSGWMWSIPTQDRLGCGYVYDSNYTTDAEAQLEIEQFLGHPITPIRIIPFESGRVEQTFCHNVVSVGLAGNFLEPLQATNIHGTIGQLYFLTEFWLRDHGHAGDVESARLNNMINQSVDTFADLIQIHYHSGRSDTPFWQNQQTIKLRPQVEYLKEMGRHRWPIVEDWPPRLGGSGYGPAIYPLIEYGWFDHAIAHEPLRNITHVQQQYARELEHIQNIADQTMSHTRLIQQLKQGTSPRQQLPTELNRLLNLGR
jgi:tryptophan halogenase